MKGIVGDQMLRLALAKVQMQPQVVRNMVCVVGGFHNPIRY